MGKTNRKPSAEVMARLAFNTNRLRRAKGYILQDLADASGLPLSYLGEIEHGRINIFLANLEVLAHGLGCEEADLLKPIPSDALSLAYWLDDAARLHPRSPGNGQEVEEAIQAQVAESPQGDGQNE
jgi:transcriptional regulator with XRE-family HTH domain